MMATLVFLAGYFVYILCMIALWFLVLVAVFPSLTDRLSSIVIPIAFIFPLAVKNSPWVVPIPGSSIVSQVVATLLCLTCYLVCTLIGLVVLGFFRPALQKHRDEESRGDRHVIIGCVTFVVMDVFMSYSSMVVNAMQGVTVLVEQPSFTSQLLSNLPFGIKATLLDPAGYLVRVLATLVALWALSFLVAVTLSVLAKILLLLDMYPKLRFTTIIGLTFMVMRCMVENSALISGMKTTLLGLAGLINDYTVAYLVLRYVTFLALALLPQVTTTCGEYNKAATIISLGLLLTMRPGPSTPIEKAALVCQSSPSKAASTGGLDDFISFSEEMMVEHKMAMEKIVSDFNLLIEESKGEIKSFVIHTILILMTLMGGMVFYVRDQYSVWINNLTDKVPGWMKWAISRESR